MKKQDDFNFVIFGATGDLTKRKLIPALYNLYKNKHVNENFLITCIARKEYTKDQFSNELKDFFKNNFKNFEEKIWNNLMSKLNYYQTDFQDQEKMSKLKDFLNNVENKNKLRSNRIYYLSTVPENYNPIVDSIKKNKLNDGKDL